MKKIVSYISGLLCISLLFTQIAAAQSPSLWPVMESSNYQKIMIPAKSGENVRFSTDDLQKRLDLEAGELSGLTISRLPAAEEGTLYLDEEPVKAFQSLTPEQIDRTVFVPAEASISANFGIIPKSPRAVATTVSVKMTDVSNNAPHVESMKIETLKNIPYTGFVQAYDPEEEEITMKVTAKPEKGTVSFDGQSFVYEPYENSAGPDRFSVCAVDAAGNLSGEAVVEVAISRVDYKIRFADMHKNPSEYAAVMLAKNGIMSGEKLGQTNMFYPKENVTRGDFLIMLMVATGYDQSLEPCVNTGLSNDREIPAWMKPYVKKAIKMGIIKEDYFEFNSIPMRCEAVLMVNRAAKISDVKRYNLRIRDVNTIPDWAMGSYLNLAAYKMLDLHDGCAYPATELRREYCADLIWQLYKYCSNVK